MAFNGFTADTLEFLFENRLHDSKTWFHENRQRYLTFVQTPLRQLAAELTPVMLKIDPLIDCGPDGKKTISRIYRDTRFSRDKSVFRDHMWLAFVRDRQQQSTQPGFYFEINQNGYQYGCGFYKCPTGRMEVLRRLILAGDESFAEAAATYDRQNVFTLCGECYKRPKYPGQPENLRNWLERKSLDFTHRSNDFKTLFSPALSDELIRGFQLLRPVYDFLCKAC